MRHLLHDTGESWYGAVAAPDRRRRRRAASPAILPSGGFFRGLAVGLVLVMPAWGVMAWLGLWLLGLA